MPSPGGALLTRRSARSSVVAAAARPLPSSSKRLRSGPTVPVAEGGRRRSPSLALPSSTLDLNDEGVREEDGEEVESSASAPQSFEVTASRRSSSASSLFSSNGGRISDDVSSPPSQPRSLVEAPLSPSSAALLAAESDSSGDEGETGQELRYKNRIGHVPLQWYRDAEHIGYDVRGQRLPRSTASSAIGRFLDRLLDPASRRTVYDEVNDEEVTLSADELAALQRLRHGSYAHLSFDPYADYNSASAFATTVRHEALGNPQEPKRRFIPSAWEAKKVVRLVQAMRNGWLKSSEEAEEEKRKRRVRQHSAFLLWGHDGSLLQGDDDAKTGLHRMPVAIPAPKLQLPGHFHSYNPPAEYLLTSEEEAAWRSQEPSERTLDFLPRRFPAMRLIPAYEGGVKEAFERCLDLYLCPRQRRKKLNVDPQSLIPRLPKPSELRPFPTRLSVEYRGHRGAVRCIAIDPKGELLVSGGEDGSVRMWEVNTGRCFKRWTVGEAAGDVPAVVEHVAFCPDASRPLISVGVGQRVLLLRTGCGSEEEERQLDAVFALQTAEQRQAEDAEEEKEAIDGGGGRRKAKEQTATWRCLREKGGIVRDGTAQPPLDHSGGGDDEGEGSAVPMDEGSLVLALEVRGPVSQVAWHRGGDYFATSTRLSSSSSHVLLHRLSTHSSQSPFSRQKGAVHALAFHPQQPFFLVATRQSVLMYHLLKQTLVKRLLSPMQSISSLSLHPSGDHLLVSSLDRRVCWFDLDLSSKPYKTLKSHRSAVRGVAFHPSYPLFASVADDGELHLFHGTAYADLLTNALIVPLKIIAAHSGAGEGAAEGGGRGRGALAVQWHPTLPFVFTAGADHTVRLFS